MSEEPKAAVNCLNELLPCDIRDRQPIPLCRAASQNRTCGSSTLCPTVDLERTHSVKVIIWCGLILCQAK